MSLDEDVFAALDDKEDGQSNKNQSSAIQLDQLVVEEQEQDRFCIEQTAFAYQNTYFWIAYSLVLEGLISYLLIDKVPFIYLSIWFGSMAAVHIMQAALVFLFKKSLYWKFNPKKWLYSIYGSWLLSGLLWGSTVLILPADASHQLLVILILICLVTPLITVLSAIRWMSLTIPVLVFAPLIIYILLHLPEHSADLITSLVIILLLYSAGGWLISISTARILEEKLEQQNILKKAQALNESLKDEIKERWKVEQALKKAKEAAELAAKTKSDFLATMSHEIRTPMNGVLGMLELLQQMEMGEEQRDLLNTAHYSAESLLAIINDILDFSKIEMGELELENIEFNLPRTLKDVTALMRKKAEEKGIYVRVDENNNVPVRVMGDPTRLRQILTNLVGNAVKFTDKGGVEVKVTTMRRSRKTAVLRFEVRDTGIGIPPDKLKRLFKPFSQADSSMARKYGGTGLGLSIAKNLVNLMGGEIGVESKPGVGSIFWFYIPVGLPAEDQGKIREDIIDVKILLIGPDSKERKQIAAFLDRKGAKVDTADTVKDALAKMSQLASIGKSWLYDVAILCPDALRNPRQVQKFVHNLSTDSVLSEVALIVYSEANKLPEQQLPVAIWLTLPVKEVELFQAVAEAASGLGNNDKIEVFVENAQPVFDEDEFKGMLGKGELVLPSDKKKKQAAPPPKPETKPQAAVTSSSDSAYAQLRVLLVEDNLVNQKVAQKILGKIGVSQIEIANNGKEAVEKVKQSQYDIILMDCQMPEMDGFEATAGIREWEKQKGYHTPIIAMTANAMEGDRERCIASGMDDYLAKPIKQPGLQEMLDKWKPKKPAAVSEQITQELQALDEHHLHVLVVEDNLVNQKVAKKLLSKLGAEVDVANNGKEALEKYQQGRYSIIFMDCQMPEMDGFEATRRIRELEQKMGYKTPIVAMTANAMEGDRERCIASGMDDYLAKPIKKPLLGDMLKKWTEEQPSDSVLEDSTMSGENESIDLAILEELQDLMEDEFPDLIRSYLKDAPKYLLAIRDAIKGSDDESLRTAAHTLKSSSANVGAMHLSALAKELELLGRQGTIKGAATLFNQAVAEFKLVKAVLEKKI